MSGARRGGEPLSAVPGEGLSFQDPRVPSAAGKVARHLLGELSVDGGCDLGSEVLTGGGRALSLSGSLASTVRLAPSTDGGTGFGGPVVLQ